MLKQEITQERQNVQWHCNQFIVVVVVVVAVVVVVVMVAAAAVIVVVIVVGGGGGDGGAVLVVLKVFCPLKKVKEHCHRTIQMTPDS